MFPPLPPIDPRPSKGPPGAPRGAPIKPRRRVCPTLRGHLRGRQGGDGTTGGHSKGPEGVQRAKRAWGTDVCSLHRSLFPAVQNARNRAECKSEGVPHARGVPHSHVGRKSMQSQRLTRMARQFGTGLAQWQSVSGHVAPRGTDSRGTLDGARYGGSGGLCPESCGSQVPLKQGAVSKSLDTGRPLPESAERLDSLPFGGLTRGTVDRQASTGPRRAHCESPNEPHPLTEPHRHATRSVGFMGGRLYRPAVAKSRGTPTQEPLRGLRPRSPLFV